MEKKNRKFLTDWFLNKEEEYEKEFTKDFIQTNENEPEEFKQIKFYHLFDITEDKYNENNFQITLDEDTGLSTIIKLKCWVWPQYSQFGRLKSNAALHHIIARVTEDDYLEENSCIKLYYTDGTSCFSKIKNGNLHGDTLRYFKDELIWIGQVVDGKGRGNCLSREHEGGGIIFGQVDENGEHTGDNIVYIYPDCKTALIGEFEQTNLIEASLGKVTCIYTENNWINIEVRDSGRYERYSYSPSDYDGLISNNPLLSDPYESSIIEIRNSGMKGGGEGIYATKDIPCGSLASIYNGVKYPLGCFLGKDCDSDEEIYEALSYNIHMPQDENFFLDIPKKFRAVSNYCATLGHKVNHSFKPNCEFSTMFHPRFGRVRTVVAKQLIKKGEELFVDYGYDLIRCPEWYRELHKTQIEGTASKNMN